MIIRDLNLLVSICLVSIDEHIFYEDRCCNCALFLESMIQNLLKVISGL